MGEFANSPIYAYAQSYEVKKTSKKNLVEKLMENLADRRKMENASKIPLKSEICCKK